MLEAKDTSRLPARFEQVNEVKAVFSEEGISIFAEVLNIEGLCRYRDKGESEGNSNRARDFL